MSKDYSVIDEKEVTEETILWFGKHKNATVRQVLDKDASYLNWCIEKKIFTVSDKLQEEIDEADMEQAYEQQSDYGWWLNADQPW